MSEASHQVEPDPAGKLRRPELTGNGARPTRRKHAGRPTTGKAAAAYDVYRDGSYLCTVSPTQVSYRDQEANCEEGHTYRVVAGDLAGNRAGSRVSLNR
ncbi:MULTISPECIES: hypothetical protein [unclassified Streptomyces]|uniref:hypothetical protein n=1 Tax=unclassified Streptomyces TaxID=2593676 RepID=UPI0023661E61|nr:MULTISPECIES: hypothetical protein [unclassified Streptomyces]MDF3143068.1 hypothetical protein [Streptomyces sp. T21Q-yed]WDF43025.1 hypothetical protein PBV52_42650 [Streptomyces sp. T12]